MSDIFFQLQFSDRSIEILENGNFSQWSGGAPVGWTVTTTGGSTVTQETTILRPGTSDGSAVRLTFDATPGTASIHQDRTLIKEAWHYLKFWIIYENYVAGENIKILIRDSGSNVWLRENGKFENGSNRITIPASDAWTYYELKFLTHPDYADYRYFISPTNSTVTSAHVIVDDAEIKLDTTFVSIYGGEINNTQYLNEINNQVISIKTSLAYKGQLENNGVNLSLADPKRTNEGVTDRKYRTIVDTNKIKAREAIARDVIGNVIARYNITNNNFSPNTLNIQLTNAYSELFNNTVPPIITEEMFPDAPIVNIGTYINHFSGQFQVNLAADKGEKNYLIARRIKAFSGTNPGRYIIGQSIQEIVAWSGSQDFQYVIDPDENEITAANCTLITPISATGTGQYHYLDLDYTEGNFEYLKVHFKYSSCPANILIDEIGNLFFSDWPFDTSDISTVLLDRNYNKLNAGDQDHTDPRFLIDSKTKYTDILLWVCENFNLSYHIDSDGNILWKILQYQDVFSSDVIGLQEDLTKLFELTGHNDPYEEIKNQFEVNWGYDGGGSNTKKMIFDLRESQKENNTIRNDDLNANFLASNYSVSKRHAHFTARSWMIDAFSGISEYTFKIQAIEDKVTNDEKTMNELLVPMQILKFKHPDIDRPNIFHYMQVKNVSRNYPDNTADVTFIDIVDIHNIDSNAALLLQSNSENENKIILDWAPNGFHIIANSGNNVEHSTDYPLFAKTSLQNIGSAPNLKIGPFGFYGDLHVFVALGSNGYASATMSLWCRFDAGGNKEVMLSQYVNANNYWELFKAAGNNVVLDVINGGITRLSMNSTGLNLADGNWHHIVFYRTDSEAGLYVDGIQVDYDTTSLNYVFATYFTAWNNGNSGNYMDGNMQDIRFELAPTGIVERTKGWFNLDPNSTPDDSYIVPWGLHSIYWRQYWIDF